MKEEGRSGGGGSRQRERCKEMLRETFRQKRPRIKSVSDTGSGEHKAKVLIYAGINAAGCLAICCVWMIGACTD